MRNDANEIALRAIRSILDAARPFSLSIDGKDVACTVARPSPDPWPEGGLKNVARPADGLWPAPVDVTCEWAGGRCVLRFEATTAGAGKYAKDLAALVRLKERYQQVVWFNLGSRIERLQDGDRLPLRLGVSLAKRKTTVAPAVAERLNDAARTLLASSKLERVSDWSALGGHVEVPSGALTPEPEEVFRRFIRVALMKMDFIDRDPRAKERGEPLIDIGRWELRADELPVSNEAAEGDDADDDAEVEGDERRYWAGGFGEPARLRQFLEGAFWQIGWKRDEDKPAARRTWSRFANVRVGDWFAIKGLGGTNDLVIRFVGEVTRVDAEAGRVDLRSFEAPLYKGKAPTGENAGAWFDTLLRVKRADVIASIFGVSETSPAESAPSPARAALDIPLNLILYGPPGTGKTFAIGERFKPSFRRALDGSAENSTFLTFHQAYGYEDFIEGIRPRLSRADDDDSAPLAYRLDDGLFKRAVRAAVRLTGFEGSLDAFCGLPAEERRRRLEGAPPYAVFIDEINRGNVARIFGELITLLEPDKRLGAENEIVVTLPYSGARFGVPKNLYVIGTMNTADRSVEALDAALRRRFDFEELAPRADLLAFDVEGDVELDEMLQAINGRLEKLLDRDHRLGHAYFLGLKKDPSLAALNRVFRNKVLPLLQEYFFGDWGKIGLVLGPRFVERREAGHGTLADFGHDDREALDGRSTWQLSTLEDKSNEDFRSIYASAP